MRQTGFLDFYPVPRDGVLLAGLLRLFSGCVVLDGSDALQTA